jgi:phage tail-like protein
MQAGRDNFRYLNREGKWLDFHVRGLEVSPRGALQLLSAPRLAEQHNARMPPVAAPAAPSGIAVDDAGRVFYAIPGENHIVVSGGCAPEQTTLTCLTEGLGLGSLHRPRGLLVLRQSERLVVADSGRDRLLFFDLRDFELREVWGRGDFGNWPWADDTPKHLHKPWTVAADADEQHIYVLDHGHRRVLKFARTGEPDMDFLARVRQSGLVPHPSALAVCGRGADVRVFIADSQAKAIFVFDESGGPLLDERALPASITWPGMGDVLALAANDTTLFVGDNAQKRILTFSLSDGFPFSGEAAGFHDYVIALALDARNGTLLAQTAAAAQPLVLAATGAYLSDGVLWSEAISAGGSAVAWHRLRASMTNAPGAHIEFYYAISDQPAHPPVAANAAEPFADKHWLALPRDVEDFLLAGDKGRFVFVGARFSSDRTATPQLTQMRVDFDTDSYTRYLPAIYREPAAEAEFLRRFVSLFQSLFEDIEDEVAALECYFDAFAAPSDALAWLATWLAVELDQGEPEVRIRQSIARAFRRYQWRGTIQGLRLALLEDAGVHATIGEPISVSSFWAMPRVAACGESNAASQAPQLGLGTHLTSTEPGGAVLGSTATLDHSYLITDAQFGEPLFAGAAWQFVVEVYRSEVNNAARLELVKAVIEREKPAHTMYRLAFIDSRMQVGAQARIGVDAIVGGTSGPTALGESDRDFGLRLSGALPPRVGVSRLGEDLKLES